MKKHLNWPEDDRVCQLPDPLPGDLCDGCCNTWSPRIYAGEHWGCIWKHGHESDHQDIWGTQWDAYDIIQKRPDHSGRCYYCGDYVPFDGMTYCGKSCAALDSK